MFHVPAHKNVSTPAGQWVEPSQPTAQPNDRPPCPYQLSDEELDAIDQHDELLAYYAGV